MSKKQNPIVDPLAVAIAQAFETARDTLLAQNTQISENAAATKSRSATLLASASALMQAFGDDTEGARKACISIYGNGDRKKDSRVVGTVAEALRAAKVTAPTVYKTLTHLRAYCLNYGNPAVRKAADEKGLDAAYQASKPAPVVADKPADVVTAPIVGITETQAGEWIDAHVEFALMRIRAWALRAKDSILVQKIAEVEMRLNDKTASK